MTRSATPRAVGKRVVVANPPTNFDTGAALRRGSRALLQFDSNAFVAALEPWARAGDVEPLIRFIKSDEHLTTDVRRGVADLIEMLHERTRPRSRGKPAGKQSLYRNPNHWAAYIARGLIRAWKIEKGQRRISDKVSEALIQEALERVGTWQVTRKSKVRLLKKTVREITRKPQHRSF